MYKSLLITLHLLRGNLKSGSSHVNLLIIIHTRNDEEHPRPTSTARQKTPKSEDDCSLVLLHSHVYLYPDEDDRVWPEPPWQWRGEMLARWPWWAAWSTGWGWWRTAQALHHKLSGDVINYRNWITSFNCWQSCKCMSYLTSDWRYRVKCSASSDMLGNDLNAK